jgi:hypothetical protein
MARKVYGKDPGVLETVGGWMRAKSDWMLMFILCGFIGFIISLLVVILVPCNAEAGPKDFFCAATAYDTGGNESVYSNEITSTFAEGHDATFTWENPTTNEDLTPYDDPGGTKLYCGALSANYNQAWDVTDPSATTATVRVNPTNRPGPPKNLQRVSDLFLLMDEYARNDVRIMWPNDRMPM